MGGSFAIAATKCCQVVEDSKLLISIVIPVKNGGPWLRNTLRSIFAQTLISRCEVLIIDSGSLDDTVDIANQFPVRVITIPSVEFNHGETRNLGVKEAKGRYVVMTVQDAEPADDRWLEKLLSGFDDDRVAGVCGQQIVPHDRDKNPIQWFKPVSVPVRRKYSYSSASHFDSLSPEQKREVCSWDDVNAIYRKDLLLLVPFRKVSFAEDALWASDALRSGYAIVYEPSAQVKHYHIETPTYTFKRVFTVSYHFYHAFGVRPVHSQNLLINSLRNIKTLLKVDGIGFTDKWRWFWYNHRQYKAVREAVVSFNKGVAAGPDQLNAIHSRVCSLVPQASGDRVS